MPYAHRRKKIPRELDRRVKISETTRENIKTMYFFERLAQREIARQTGVSRRMVSFIIFPEREARCKEQYKERRKDGRYYNPKTWPETMKEHRHYKQSIKENLT